MPSISPRSAAVSHFTSVSLVGRLGAVVQAARASSASAESDRRKRRGFIREFQEAGVDYRGRGTSGAESVAPATVAPRRKQRYGRSMSTLLATAVNNNNRNNLRANNRARPMRDCDQG